MAALEGTSYSTSMPSSLDSMRSCPMDIHRCWFRCLRSNAKCPFGLPPVNADIHACLSGSKPGIFCCNALPAIPKKARTPLFESGLEVVLHIERVCKAWRLTIGMRAAS